MWTWNHTGTRKRIVHLCRMTHVSCRVEARKSMNICGTYLWEQRILTPAKCFCCSMQVNLDTIPSNWSPCNLLAWDGICRGKWDPTWPAREALDISILDGPSSYRSFEDLLTDQSLIPFYTYCLMCEAMLVRQGLHDFQWVYTSNTVLCERASLVSHHNLHNQDVVLSISGCRSAQSPCLAVWSWWFREPWGKLFATRTDITPIVIIVIVLLLILCGFLGLQSGIRWIFPTPLFCSPRGKKHDMWPSPQSCASSAAKHSNRMSLAWELWLDPFLKCEKKLLQLQ